MSKTHRLEAKSDLFALNGVVEPEGGDESLSLHPGLKEQYLI